MKNEVNNTQIEKDKNDDEEISTIELVKDFLSTFLIAFFAIVALALVASKLLGFNILTVDSGSMEPTYGVDSLIFVKSVDPSTIVEGDVITFVFDEAGDLVTHRVVGIDSAEHKFTTKGDANNDKDGAPVLWENVVGKVSFGIPKIGAVFRAVTARENRTIVIIAIGSLVGFTVVWEIVAALRNKLKNKDISNAV